MMGRFVLFFAKESELSCFLDISFPSTDLPSLLLIELALTYLWQCRLEKHSSLFKGIKKGSLDLALNIQ